MNILFHIIKSALKLLLKPQKSYSQFGEDTVVATLLPNRGFYVDVGAFHPHLYSNTYLLYKKGWKGVAIDPNPRAKVLFRVFRPRDMFVQSGVGEKRVQQEYYMYSDPAYNGFREAQKLHKSVRLIKKVSLSIQPLTDILPQGRHIDFLNIDVEGMDLQVLKTLDWSDKPSVIAVEGEKDGPTHSFLEHKGYQLNAVCGLTLIFVKI